MSIAGQDAAKLSGDGRMCEEAELLSHEKKAKYELQIPATVAGAFLIEWTIMTNCVAVHCDRRQSPACPECRRTFDGFGAGQDESMMDKQVFYSARRYLARSAVLRLGSPFYSNSQWQPRIMIPSWRTAGQGRCRPRLEISRLLWWGLFYLFFMGLLQNHF